MSSPTAVFKAFKTKSLLQEIARAKSVDISETDSKSKIVKILAADASGIGLRRLLSTLKLTELTGLAAGIDWGEDKKPPKTKGVLAKRIAEAIEKDPGYIQERDPTVLDKIVKTLDMDVPHKKEVGKKILEEADSYGLENYFSSFPIERLQEFAEDCGLDVRSQSRDILIDCLTSQEDYKVKKKKTKTEKPSKKKPDIKNGISKVDLVHHYYRDELLEYCKEHGLNTTGNKKEFIQRIIAHVEGKPQPPVKGKKKSKKKAKKSKSEESKSDKSDKSESDTDDKSEDKSDEKKKEKTESKSTEKGKEKTKDDKEKAKEKEKGKEKAKEKSKEKGKEKTVAKEGSPEEEGKGKKRKAEDNSSDSDSKKKTKK